MGVDAGGRVVGGYAGRDGRTHGFVWQDRSYQTVDAPDASGTTLIRINDQGQLLGVYDDDRHACHSFLLRNGKFAAVQVDGNPTEALDLNNHGAIAGSYLGRDGKLHGFLQNYGSVTTIDFPEALGTAATSVNDEGVVVGYYLDTQHQVHGYLREHDGLLTDINVPGADGFTLPFGVAAGEQTVGEFVGADAIHGFRTDGDRYMSFDAPGTGTVNQVYDVTDGGTIVGYSGHYVSNSRPDPDRAANDILDLWLARA
jgi:uncharacterized membrane protein